jgi:hypothetical protein
VSSYSDSGVLPGFAYVYRAMALGVGGASAYAAATNPASQPANAVTLSIGGPASANEGSAVEFALAATNYAVNNG